MCLAMMHGLCHNFEYTLTLSRDLMEDSDVASNLSIPKVSARDSEATSARASRGGMFSFSG